jgi:NAD(P)-dependent dehydrogenase (short-subunit alcohol dehydrogenase family)
MSGETGILMTNQERATLAVSMGVGAACLAWWQRARRAISFDSKSVVIVGGSRGLGLVMARELADEGASLVLVARDAEELERARLDLEGRGASARVVVGDMRRRDDVNRVIDEIATNGDGIDVLINNAGIIQVGPFDTMTIEDFEEAMATHFWGPLYTIRAALPLLRRSSARRIVNISSIGGKIAVPHLVPYCASKFALCGLSEGLRAELAREGIRVTTVCPGLMRTGSTYNAWFKGQHRREFAWFHLASSVPGLTIDARRAARQVIEACRYGDAELTITLPARVGVILNAMFPGLFASVMTMSNRLLPTAEGPEALEERSGWQSVSTVAPSPLSRLTDRATMENNEVPGEAPTPTTA